MSKYNHYKQIEMNTTWTLKDTIRKECDTLENIRKNYNRQQQCPQLVNQCQC